MKRLTVIAALVCCLAPLSQAHAQVAVSVNTPQFGFTIGAPFFGPPVFVAPVFAPPVFAPVPVFAPARVYAPAPAYARVYAPIPVYRPVPRVIYVPRHSPHPHDYGKPRPTPDFVPYPMQNAGWLPPGHARRYQVAHGDFGYGSKR